jgi:phosphomannomutase
MSNAHRPGAPSDHGALASAVSAALDWAKADPDPATRRELESLAAARDLDELRERFERPLDFGTAGLRGIVGAGPARMNRAVVMRATHALAEELVRRDPDARSRPVAVGFDARTSSRAFAEAAIGVLVAVRIPVRYFPEPVPTPLVAYAVRALAATAGIVITASHNPADYNGYKLYAADGAQVVPPLDRAIEARMAKGPGASSIPCASFTIDVEHPLAQRIGASLVERYYGEIDALIFGGHADRTLRIAYTPLHGVGLRFAREALRRRGFSDVRVVPEQAEPDGAFPTVHFPNPEEPGALDRVMTLAKHDGAALVLANDPDADRLAAAVPTAAGRFIALSGNQIGVLLADFVLEHAPRTPTPLVVSTIVSTPMLENIAQAHGARCERTLTGFKWIAHAAMALESRDGVRFAFGFEEAIGYAAGRFVRDKDGVSAAVLFAELAAHARAEGRSVLERLEALYRRHGLWVSVQKSVVLPGRDGAARIARAVDGIVQSLPVALDGTKVHSVVDYRLGASARAPWLGVTPLVALDFGAEGRAFLRPSGTEPKLKIYVDLTDSVAPSDDLWVREAALRARATRIADALAGHAGLET